MDVFATIAAIIDAAGPVAAPDGAAPDAASSRKRPRDKAARERSESSGVEANRVDSLSASPKGETTSNPQDHGFDIDGLNRQYALVLMGSKSVIFFEQPKAPLEDNNRILTLEAFNAWFANRKTQVAGPNGTIKTVTWARRWIEHPKRRSYQGVEFHPDPQNAPGVEGYLNLWSGFAVKPGKPGQGIKYKVFRDHLLNNVCRGVEGYFKWVFGFFAHVVQRPRERIGTALVMCGKMGTGKTKVGEIIGRLFPRHYFLVDDPRYVTGQFNAHMATCLLLQADEAVWAGDKAAEGRLKGLITSPIQQIEAKGVDPIRLPNYVRLIMTSNEEWVVPAGMDERRFAVFEVDPRCAQNHAYFREMDEELAAGGLEALLADLLAFDLDSVEIWKIPRTEALLEQKIQSLRSVESWWLERLMSGSTSRNGTHWHRQVACSALFKDYLKISDDKGERRKKEETVFGIKMVRLVPGLRRVKRTVDVEDDRGLTIAKRVWCYELPTLEEARDAFDQHVEQPIKWPVDEDDERKTESRETEEF